MNDEQIPEWAIKLIIQVERLNEKIPTHVDWVERNIKDHEERIREVEKFRWRMAGIASLSSGLVAIAIEILSRTVLK